MRVGLGDVMAHIHSDTIESIQIEPTSRCNLHCSTCLKPAYGDAWQEHDMDAALFARLLEQIKGYKPTVHLQGWGESLLHERIFSYILDLKNCDIPVTFSSNGTTLTEALADEVVQSGLDGITFSMSGTCSATQDPLRGEGSFACLEMSVKIMVAARNRYNSSVPKIAISYLLTPQTVRELPEAVAWCARHEIDALVCVAMTQVGTGAQELLRFTIKKEEARHYRLLRIRANLQALLRGVSLDMKPFHPVLTGGCSKDPLHSLFISSRGEVSPCVFQCPPIGEGGLIGWRYEGERKKQAPVIFGNLADRSLREIWEGEEYRKFRETWRKRLAFHDEKLGRVTYSLAGSTELEKAVVDINEYFERHPVPDACAFCLKKDGF